MKGTVELEVPTCSTSPEGSELTLGSLIRSHPKIVGSSLYTFPVTVFFLRSTACKHHTSNTVLCSLPQSACHCTALRSLHSTVHMNVVLKNMPSNASSSGMVHQLHNAVRLIRQADASGIRAQHSGSRLPSHFDIVLVVVAAPGVPEERRVVLCYSAPRLAAPVDVLAMGHRRLAGAETSTIVKVEHAASCNGLSHWRQQQTSHPLPLDVILTAWSALDVL